MLERCGILVPRPWDIEGSREDRQSFECILPWAHGVDPRRGEHVFKTPSGKYFAWEDDLECGCCEPNEDDRCYNAREITKEEAHALGGRDV